MISGRERLSGSVELGYEDWATTVGSSGTTMDGTFTLRFFPAQNGV
jgi:hypothetical protein